MCVRDVVAAALCGHGAEDAARRNGGGVDGSMHVHNHVAGVPAVVDQRERQPGHEAVNLHALG
jgi:hypothetical protein